MENMTFKDFIISAIYDITNAIDELQNNMKNGAVVSPSLDKTNSKSIGYNEVNRIEFDVAVATEQTGDEKKKFGITMFALPVGGGGEWEDSHKFETVSRLKFSIPLIYPSVSREETRKLVNRIKE